MVQLHIYKESDTAPLIRKREGETKLGEKITYAAGITPEALRASTARFVLLGLPEDIGVRANGGVGGAHTAWDSFLAAFLNIQDTVVLPGSAFLLWGAVDFSGWMDACADAGQEQLREYTARIDDMVYPLIRAVIAAGKIPLVIGGGHNNAYPLLKATALATGKPVHAVNLDAHADFRAMEGRHSGNGFRYAFAEGILTKYAMLGLHEAYNSQPVVTELLAAEALLPLFWEDIFLHGQYSWPEAVETAIQFVAGETFGVELDVDCIEQVLSSAATPVGINAQQAMHYLYHCGLQSQAVYLHLPEGITERADGQRNIFTGKLLSYLVQAFAKGVLKRP